MMTKFVHFRSQSSYSMLESAIKVDELVALTRQHKMSAICLSDRGNLFASLEFALAAFKVGIQPIHGSILTISYINNGKENFAEILLIAKDEEGYKNLLKLVSYSFIKNNRSKYNHITIEDLISCNTGLIALSAYTEGIIGNLLKENAIEDAIIFTSKLQAIFSDRFYFEIMRRGTDEEKLIEGSYLNIANELKIPLIATNQILFSKIEMHDAHDVLLCISAGVVREEQNRKRVSNQCYFKSTEEMITLFSDLPEAIENTVQLMQRCYYMVETRAPSLPNFTNGSKSEEELIWKESQEGLEQKLKSIFITKNLSDTEQQSIRTEYFNRLNYELDIICRMNFAGYFLIVSDFIRWSKENGIAVGPGRGSGAGSIIAWVLQITDLDPIHFGLLFERFLNPERVSMPDFDIDFCQERREEVIDYVRSKYGNDRVGQIITFGKMQAKAVIKDVARVLGLGYTFADYLTELVPFNAVNPVTLSQAITEVAELAEAANGRGLYNLTGEEELIKQVLDTAIILEGLHRHASTHAAGIVIANQNMIDIVPLYKDLNSDMLIVQYSMKYCELAGLVKFDFLGLQTLTVITNCLKLITNQGINIDINNIPFNDTKTFSMLSNGESSGVFQFESIGMKNALRRLKPDNIEDIIALGALYRPGPMDNIPTYIACKHGTQEVDYLHPILEPILKSTYGVIIYQEQVMEIARRLSNYSLGAADLLRRAMGKKVKAEMDAQEEIFVSGAKQNLVPAEQAKSIFNTVAKFAGYGFNKSHATAYGLISYQTAYLKANYTIEFLVASLNLDINDSDKINMFLQEAKNFGVKIIAPSINISNGYFSIGKNDTKEIIFCLGAIKNVTISFGNAVQKEREENGKFYSIIDFIERMDPKLINRRLLENIIKAGCFDSLHSNRNSLLHSVPKIMAYSISYHTERQSHQFSLIAVNTNSNNILVSCEELSRADYAYQEFEVLGLFIDNHPLQEYKELFKKHNVLDSVYLRTQLKDGSNIIKLAGIIVKKDTRMSKRGRFITLVLSDACGMFEVTLYNENIIKQYANLINIKQAVIIHCEVFKDAGGIRVIAKSFQDPNDLIQGAKFDIKLYPKNKDELENMLQLLSRSVDSNNNSEVTIFLPLEGGFVSKINLSIGFNIGLQDLKILNVIK